MKLTKMIYDSSESCIELLCDHIDKNSNNINDKVFFKLAENLCNSYSYESDIEVFINYFFNMSILFLILGLFVFNVESSYRIQSMRDKVDILDEINNNNSNYKKTNKNLEIKKKFFEKFKNMGNECIFKESWKCEFNNVLKTIPYRANIFKLKRTEHKNISFVDEWIQIEECESNPWVIIEKIKAGIIPKTNPLHFINNYKVKTMEKLQELKQLSIEGYNIISLNCLETEINEIPKEMVNLEYLNCESTQVTYIPKELINLKKIKCHNNEISEIPKELINLEKLYCSNNLKISEIPKELINLKVLDCRRTQVNEIPKDLINLEWLNCESTQVTYIPKELINLKSLIFFNTQVSEIPKELINLKVLDCSESQVSEIPKELINLEDLDCRTTQVSEIPKELINLKVLDCSESQVSEIPKELINLKV